MKRLARQSHALGEGHAVNKIILRVIETFEVALVLGWRGTLGLALLLIVMTGCVVAIMIVAAGG